MLAVVSHNRVIRMQLTREMLPSRFYLIVSLFVLTAAEVDEKCFNLCRQFVQHVANEDSETRRWIVTSSSWRNYLEGIRILFWSAQ